MIQPCLEIDLDAIVENWRMFTRRAGRGAAAVVKADAYGLGAQRVGAALATAGCRRFYVAWPHEGATLRAAVGPAPDIAIFHGFARDALEVFQAHALEPVLNSLAEIDAWISSGMATEPASLHLDTGMNRLGLPVDDWASAAGRLSNPNRLLSHLACGDEVEHPANIKQRNLFARGCDLWPQARRSLAATAGAYLGADYTMDEVRPGVGLYGGGPSPAFGEAPKTAVTLTAPILQVRRVLRGDSVGYGQSWTAYADVQVATVGLGYADGYLRGASNKATCSIGGTRRSILGRVSMDLVMVDVTDLSVAPGDEVEFLGPDMPISEVATAMDTIDYELLTRLGSRFVRRYRQPR